VTTIPILGAQDRSRLVRRGLVLEYATVSWNVAEAFIAIIAGAVAGSIALVGFGIDSVIEVSSGVILLWRLHSDASHQREVFEARALKFVGWSLLALAAYVLYESASALWLRERPEHSFTGIVLAALSLIVMPLLARAKRRVAARINSRALHADSIQTSLCAYLSAILLGGLVLNAVLGWWWADPLAALCMLPIITREGLDALKGKTCCDSCH
jgi:divalent metal cation (Fe/Co/Zn/Cd) transporter